MKNLKKISLIALSASMLMLYSCKKDEVNEPINSLASGVIGTYSGTLKNSGTNQSKNATLTVTMQNDSLVRMHCVAQNFDSTVMVQLYENHDSIMACYAGQDFYNEYGHNTNNYDFCNNQQSGWMNQGWMGDENHYGNHNNNWGNSTWAGNEQWNAWTNHMNTQHNKTDRHYGGFNPTANTCFYEFAVLNSGTEHFEIFEGVKQ